MFSSLLDAQLRPRGNMSGYNLPQYSTRSTSFHSQASILDRIIAALPKELASIVKKTLDRQNYDSLGYSRPAVHGSVHGLPRNLKQIQRRVKTNWRNWFNVPNACILIWAVLLLWGERWTFESAIKACKWKNWERWVCAPLKTVAHFNFKHHGLC